MKGARHVNNVLKAGFLSKKEKFAIEFATDLEANEKCMAEQAALMITLEQHGLEYEDYPYVMMKLPDGEWWKAANLPVYP